MVAERRPRRSVWGLSDHQYLPSCRCQPFSQVACCEWLLLCVRCRISIDKLFAFLSSSGREFLSYPVTVSRPKAVPSAMVELSFGAVPTNSMPPTWWPTVFNECVPFSLFVCAWCSCRRTRARLSSMSASTIALAPWVSLKVKKVGRVSSETCRPLLNMEFVAQNRRVLNLASKDQIAALQWVQANIRHFGGDPQKVHHTVSLKVFILTSRRLLPSGRVQAPCWPASCMLTPW